MGDFDAVLERLMVDGPFRAALAADPDAALAGYRLSPDEVDLLRSQVSTGGGTDRTVETRTSKSSLFGMLGSLAGLAENPGMMPPQPAGAGTMGEAVGHLGAAHQHESLAAASGHGSLFDADAQTGQGDLGTQGAQMMGSVGSGMLDPVGSGHGSLLPSGDHTPVGYHPHIDADGDHKWDHYTAVQHADGSVDIYEDRNHDGRIDFIGHDRNHDGRVESADYDENFNGTFETHMRDLNGDGWLDTREVMPDPPAQGTETIGEAMPSPKHGF